MCRTVAARTPWDFLGSLPQLADNLRDGARCAPEGHAAVVTVTTGDVILASYQSAQLEGDQKGEKSSAAERQINRLAEQVHNE